MKCSAYAPLLLLLAGSSSVYAADQLIPAGSLIQCTVSEPKLSSKTVAIGDPVLCKVSHVEMYGRSVFPYGSYMVGRFEDYKDPGHFVGKGWMELKFDRMIMQPDTVIPLEAKVVHVPNYPVDREGRIDGKGHPVRDSIEWAIPVLWPIDVINLPRRGPRPTLKEETRLTLKIMDDLEVPLPEKAAPEQPGLRRRTPTSSLAPDDLPLPQAEPAPATYAVQRPQPVPQPEYENAAPPPPSDPVSYGPVAPPRPVLIWRVPPPPPPAVVMQNAGGYPAYGVMAR